MNGSLSVAQFPPAQIAARLGVSIGVGMLIGLEREWSQKDLGARTFTIISLLGALSGVLSHDIIVGSFGGVIALIILVNVNAIRHHRPVEATTSSALLVTFVLGVLVGEGHFFTPVAVAILMTMLLSLKFELHRFTGGLLPDEIRSAALLGLIGFVIRPILPDRSVDPWHLLNPRELWITVIAIAAIGFVNYVLLRLYSARGLVYTAILGGLVNSTATIAELASWLKQPEFGDTEHATLFCFVTVIAMFARNLALVAIFAPDALPFAAWPVLAMALCATVFVIGVRKKHALDAPALRLELTSPISLKKLGSFGLLFIAVEIAGAVAQRVLGKHGLLLVSLAGGLVSSASTTAAAANLSAHGETTASVAGAATVLTSLSSAFVNIPVIRRVGERPELMRGLWIRYTIMAAAGLAAWLVQSRV